MTPISTDAPLTDEQLVQVYRNAGHACMRKADAAQTLEDTREWIETANRFYRLADEFAQASAYQHE